jgi:peptidoglycan/xylan/chitin deacetylase (PgdA/CDA1 family)
MPNSTLCLSFDFDAMSVWFGYGHVTPAMLQRGEYGARVGVFRVLDLLARYQLPATFFIPGHTIDSFPEAAEAIQKAAHEIAHHSYAHTDPNEQTPNEERQDMERALESLEKFGVKPLGYRSPSADISPVTLSLLEEYSFLYDSSLMADDFHPYHPRLDDQVSRSAPLIKGKESRLWELPISF